MKKMTTEEKAKEYDIALKKIERLLGSGDTCSREELEYVFPQLRESEYERVRKEILQELKESEDSIILSPFKRERWIAWLESQGDKSETDFQGDYNGTLFKIATVLSQYEDKQGSPLEKIREIMVDGACWAMDSEKKKFKKIEQDNVWNEEDEDIYLSILNDLRQNVMPDKEDIDWLKALKDRYAWKPTDEQMKALDDVISSRGIKYDVLSELWNDLRKIKEV